MKNNLFTLFLKMTMGGVSIRLLGYILCGGLFLGFTIADNLELLEQQEDAGEVPLTDSNDIAKEFLGDFTDKDNTLVDLLIKYQEIESEKGKLVEHYCDTWLKTHSSPIQNLGYNYITYNGMKFDPRQSMFVYGLCMGYAESTNISKREETFDVSEIVPRSNDPTQNYQKEIEVNISDYIPDNIKNNLLGERRNLESKDVCEPKNGMADCRMGYPSSNILISVFGAYFDLKKSAIDGYNHGKTKTDIDNAIKDFSRALFNQEDTKMGVCADPSKTFISADDSAANDEQSHCGHPQTYAFVENMIQSAIEDVDRIEDLDAHKIIESECESPLITIHACAMSTVPDVFANPVDHNNGLDAVEEVAWHNLIANELFFANMWKDFYTIQLLNNTRFQGGDKQENLIGSNASVAQMEVASMHLEFDMITKAADRLMTLLTQYRSMYHQCVALGAHQEDLHYFWQRANKMYTPLHQLQTLFSDPQEAGGS